jgi:hypothetical protein
MKSISLIFFFILAAMPFSLSQENKRQWNDNIQVVLDNTAPLKYDRGNRLPLYLWPAMDPGQLDDESAELLVKELDKRGVGLICSWSSEDREKALTQCLPVARAQKKLGLFVNIDATSLLYSFFNGDVRTAHIDKNGNPFFDDSFGPHKMGCPFAIDFQKKEIRDRVDFFVNKYKDDGLSVDFIFTDWEIDGPLEFNRAFEASKNCTRCCNYLGDDFSFTEFQKTIREIRSYLQNYSYSESVLSQFPDALVGNYAVYPNDGYRYWYDYFEYYVDGQPYKADQQAKYRQWYNDFPATGYSFAMPVVYTWAPTYNWYNFDNSDYRWFYNMLLVASNAGKSTPPSVPIISFVHWHTIFASGNPDPAIKQMSEESYQELLWHMLLRGTDTFFMWSDKTEYPKEVQLLHEVYAAAQEYGDFLEHGMPITYDVPKQPGTVISGLVLKDRVLIRRTDFGTDHTPVKILAGTKVISVEYAPGACMILDLN